MPKGWSIFGAFVRRAVLPQAGSLRKFFDVTKFIAAMCDGI